MNEKKQKARLKFVKYKPKVCQNNRENQEQEIEKSSDRKLP